MIPKVQSSTGVTKETKTFNDFDSLDWKAYFQNVKFSDDLTRPLAHFKKFALRPENHSDALDALSVLSERKIPGFLKRDVGRIESDIEERQANPISHDMEHQMFKPGSIPGQRKPKVHSYGDRVIRIHMKPTEFSSTTIS